MKELFEHWQDTKSVLMEGLDPRKAAIVSTVLDNQAKYLNETAGAEATSTGNIGSFQKIILPMVRRIIPGTIATEIVGVRLPIGSRTSISSRRGGLCRCIPMVAESRG